MTEAVVEHETQNVVELTADIVAAYVSNHVVQPTDLPSLIQEVHAALTNTARPQASLQAAEKQKPAVSVRKSINGDHLVCLECGGNFKSLKRHLMTHHELTPDAYRDKWDLAADYPMVAPSYAEARSRLAKEMGLGQRRKG